MMIKILFFIHDLGQGGAEKVLLNLVNNMDKSKFHITVIAMFGGGVNEKYLSKEVNYRTIFRKSIPGNRVFLKVFSPSQLHHLFVKERYDIEISYLEGPSARVISGCRNKETKLVSWIHSSITSSKIASRSFRSKKEAIECYNHFDLNVGVSRNVLSTFLNTLPIRTKSMVLYNTVDSEKIIRMSKESVGNLFDQQKFNLIAVGSLKKVKGFERLLQIVGLLVRKKYPIHLYILGKGPLRKNLEEYIHTHSLGDYVSFLGYQENPYKYIVHSDLFVCSSYSEGFSTAATEALILGTPVCTTDVSGMKELLGENNEYGIITDNERKSLYKGIKRFLDSKELVEHYKEKAAERGKIFDCDSTVKRVEESLNSLLRT